VTKPTVQTTLRQTPTYRFSHDSPLEEDGFELSVPPARTRDVQRFLAATPDGTRRTASTTTKPARTARVVFVGTRVPKQASTPSPIYFRDKAVEPRISVKYRPGWLTLLSRSAEVTLFAGQFGRLVHAWRTCCRHQIRSHSRFAMMPTLASIAAAASRQMSSR
jgi:hypothetical protein